MFVANITKVGDRHIVTNPTMQAENFKPIKDHHVVLATRQDYERMNNLECEAQLYASEELIASGASLTFADLEVVKHDPLMLLRSQAESNMRILLSSRMNFEDQMACMQFFAINTRFQSEGIFITDDNAEEIYTAILVGQDIRGINGEVVKTFPEGPNPVYISLVEEHLAAKDRVSQLLHWNATYFHYHDRIERATEPAEIHAAEKEFAGMF